MTEKQEYSIKGWLAIIAGIATQSVVGLVFILIGVIYWLFTLTDE